MQSEQRESVEVSPHLSESSGAILRSDSRILNDTIPRAAPSSFRKKSNSNGKLFLVFLFLLLLTSIALIITYFVAIPVHITKKFQKDQFNLEFLQLKEFNLLPNNDTHLLLKTQLKIPRVYYRNELVQVNAVSGFSGLFIIVVKPAAVQEMQTLSNDQAVVAEVDFQVKFKSPEFFQRIALAFIASQNGLPYTVGTLYFQFLSTFSAGNFFKYENFPAFRVVNLTGQSLKTFVSENSPKMAISKDPIFKFSSINVNTIEKGISIDFTFRHLIGLSAQFTQSKPYHVYVNDEPFLEIKFSPMNFAYETVQSNLKLQFLDVPTIKTSFLHLFSMWKGANFSSLKLVHPLQDSSSSKEPHEVLAKSSSLTLLPLPEKAVKQLNKMQAEKPKALTIEREWTSSLTSISLDTNNTFLVEMNTEVTPAIFEKQDKFRFDNLVMDIGVRAILIKEETEFLSASASHFQTNRIKKSDSLNNQLRFSFSPEVKAVQYREEFLKAFRKRNASFDSQFTFSTFVADKNKKCDWCNAIQSGPFPLPLEMIFNRLDSSPRSGIFTKYITKVKTALKTAEVTFSLDENNVKTWTTLNVLMKTNNLPTHVNLGSISFDVSFNGHLLMHVDTSIVSKGACLHISLRVKDIQYKILAKVLNHFIDAYFSGTCPKDGCFTLTSLKVGTSYQCAKKIIHSDPSLRFDSKGVFDRIVPRMPKYQDLAQRLTFLDFSKYKPSEQPVSAIELSDSLIKLRAIFYLKKKLPLPNIKDGNHRFQIEGKGKSIVDIQFSNLNYDSTSSRLEFVLSIVASSFIEKISEIKKWLTHSSKGEIFMKNIQSMKLTNKLHLPLNFKVPYLGNASLTLTLDLNNEAVYVIELSNLNYNKETSELEFTISTDSPLDTSSFNLLIEGIKDAANGNQNSKLRIKTVKLKYGMKLSKPLSILDIEHRELFFDITDNDKKIAKFEFSDVLYDKDTLQLDFTVSIQVYVSIGELRSLIDEYKAIANGNQYSKLRINTVKLKYGMKLSKPLSILDIEHRELFFDITDNDKKIAKFEFSDVLYDKDTLQLDFTVSIQVYISISELRSLIDEYKAIVLGHKKVKPRKFNLEYSITLPQAPPIPNFLLNEFYFTFFTDDDNAKKIGLNSKWSTHHDPSTLNTRAVLSGNLEFSVSDFPALAQTLYTSIFDKKSNSKNKINAVLKTAIQLPEKFSKAIFLSSDLFMSVTFAMGGKRILEVECSDVSNKPGTSEYDISLSFKLLGSVSKISSLIQGLKKSLKGDFSSSITLMDVKFGPLKKNAMILCKELPVSFLVNEYKLLRFSSPPTEMLQLQGSENFNSGLKKNQDETETNNRGQHIGSLSSDPIRALARKSNKETQSELVHTTSFFSYLRNAVEKFIQFIKDKLGLGAIDPDWNTHCFHENESPVNVVRLDALHFDITLISCLPKTLPIEMALPNVKLKLFLSDQPLASLTLDHMKVKANPRFEFHSQLRIETNKEQIQSGILSCLDAFSKYLKDKSSFSIFHLFRYSLVIGDSIQVHSKVLEEMIASKMKKSDLTTPTEFRFWTFEGLGSLHFELDSLGLHLDFDVLYSIPLPLSFQFDDFGFFLYHRNDQVLQILLNRPHLTNKVFKSTLSILPHQENIRLVFESFILSPAEFNIGEWFFRALNTESMKQKSFLKIPADILLSQVNEFKRKIPAGNPMPLIHRYPHILFPTFALARARILFFKSTKLSIRIPYFEIRFKSLDEKCLVIRLNESGINFPARNEHAIISIVAPSAFVLKELSNIAKSFKPVFLAFGNSETNAFRLIDRSTFTTDILFKLILGMMHTQEEALPTEGTIPVEAMPTETKPTNAGLKAAEVPPEEVAVQPESENGEKEDEEFLKIEFDDDEEGEDWASSEPTQSLSEAINEVKWPELSDEVKNSEAIINITDTCIV